MEKKKKDQLWKLIFENHLYQGVSKISEILMEENIKSEEEKKVCKSKEEKKVRKWSISI